MPQKLKAQPQYTTITQLICLIKSLKKAQKCFFQPVNYPKLTKINVYIRYLIRRLTIICVKKRFEIPALLLQIASEEASFSGIETLTNANISHRSVCLKTSHFLVLKVLELNNNNTNKD